MDKTWKKLLAQDSADAFIRQAFDLKKVPELAVLDGIAERLDYHPEGDCGIHMRMVLEQAFALTRGLPEKRKIRARAGAALHDLGKAVSGGKTPDDRGELRLFDPSKASHLEHDKLGLRLVAQVARRWELDGALLEFCQQVAWRHQAAHRICDKNEQLDRGAVTMLKNLTLGNREVERERAEWEPAPLALGWRDREWVEDFCLAVQADSYGRLIPQSERVYPQARLLMAAWDSLASARHHRWPLDERGVTKAMGALMGVAKKWEERRVSELSPKGEAPKGLLAGGPKGKISGL